MIPPWVLFAVAAGLFSNVFNTLCRYFLKDKDDATIWAWFFEVGRLVVFSIIVFFDFSIKWELKTLLLLLIIGLTELGGDYFTMKMHAYTQLSISTIISRTRMIWIPLIAFLLLGEHLQGIDYLGILVLFLGVSITVSPHKFFIDKGAIFANLGAVVLAFNTTLLKAALPQASYSVILLASTVPSVTLFPFVIKNVRKNMPLFIKKKFPLKIAAVLVHVVSIYCLLAALNTGDASKVNAIYQGMLISSVLFGIIFFKERQDVLRKCIGALVTIVGIILVTQ